MEKKQKQKTETVGPKTDSVEMSALDIKGMVTDSEMLSTLQKAATKTLDELVKLAKDFETFKEKFERHMKAGRF